MKGLDFKVGNQLTVGSRVVVSRMSSGVYSAWNSRENIIDALAGHKLYRSIAPKTITVPPELFF